MGIRLSLLLLTLWSTTLTAEETPHWHKPGYISAAFTQVALRNEYTLTGNVVRKWSQPITVWIDHQVGDEAMHTELVEMHLKHLSAVTGHPIKLTEQQQKANLTLIFTRQADWGKQVERLFGKEAAAVLHGAVCMANFRTNGHYEILEAGVIIPVDQARMHGKLVSCIVEELTQVMGLPNDADSVYPSIFNDKTPEQLLSGLDGLLLKLLYHPSINAGQTEREVKPLADKILLRWADDGTIHNAANTIRQGGLYPLLGY